MDLAEQESEAAEIVHDMLSTAEPIVAVDETLEWIWRAWHRLGDDRKWIAGGMGASQPAGIPWTAVVKWAERHGMDQEDEDLLDCAIAAMDRVYKQWWSEKAKEAANQD